MTSLFPPHPQPPGKLLALDVGLARIGLATCDPLGLSVRPLDVLARRSRRQDFDRLAHIIRNEEVEGLLCGLPLHMDGSEGEQARTTRRWAGRLMRALGHLLACTPPLLFWDERLSSHSATVIQAETADKQLAAAGEDAVAAGVILQSFLDARARGAEVTRYGGYTSQGIATQ